MGSLHAQTVFDDGSAAGPALYVGGEFTTTGGIVATFVAKWDGASWSPLGSGMNSHVFALTVFDDGNGPALYAGGTFITAGGVTVNRIAKWNGSSWSPLGTGMNDSVWSLSVFDDGSGPALFAGGSFTTAGGVSANRIAKWNGSAWSSLGSGMNHPSNPIVFAMAEFDDDSGAGPALYAGGTFTTAGGVSVNNIAKWNGSSWSSLGGGMNASVRALITFDDGSGDRPALYAGGDFITAGGVAANRMAKWDGSSWSGLSSGMNNWVRTLTIFDDGSGAGPALYVGGAFTTVAGVAAARIAKWDGVAWSALGSGTNSTVQTLAVFDDGSGAGPALFAGGSFTIAGTTAAIRIAKWNGSSWSSLGSGLSSAVLALAYYDDGLGAGPALYAGGEFTTASHVTVNYIAKWDGSSWSPLGSGMNDAVLGLTVFDDGSGTGPALYASGRFTIASGVTVNHIAKWDGSSWSALGSGLSSGAGALAVFDDGSGPALYVGGSFSNAGGVAANRIAKWDGSSWSPLGSGMNGSVHCLAVFNDGSGPALYAGGWFSTAGGVTVNNVAKWNGSSWSPLSSGVGTGDSPFANAMAGFDDGAGSGPALFVGGGFMNAGGLNVNRIAKWNGSSWSPVGSGTNNRIWALTTFHDGTKNGAALYAGGEFITAGGVTARGVAKWDGSIWSPLGTGALAGSVSVVAGFDTDPGVNPDLFVGGWFTVTPAGDSYLGKWQGCIPQPKCAPADINCDGVVNVNDLLAVINAWGKCPLPPATCPADIAPPSNGDGVVNVNDLLMVINNWG